MPLSNPTDHAEAVPADIYNWTRGRALVGTGSPFPDVLYEGVSYRIGQANNVFVFPGVGLGTLASGAREVLPEFFTAAAKAVSSCVAKESMAAGTLLPPVTELANVSLKVAQAVGEAAIANGVSRSCAFSSFQHQNDPTRLKELVRRMRWSPDYLPLVAM
jgi:malate dehydrogenase (oxaloacetate-decarboxylating)